MAEADAFASQIAELLRRQQSADIVVGLPTCNHAETAVGIVRAVRAALQGQFPDKKAIIVNVDGGSTDGTTIRLAELADAGGAVLAQVRLSSQDLVLPYHGVPGKGDGFRLVMQVARQMEARVCLVLSPDIEALPAEWISAFIAPILQDGFDFVEPVYLRHRFDGAIISSIVRPLIQSLYGKRIEQPVAAEYALSTSLVERCLGYSAWESDLGRFGTDIWTLTQALCVPFKVCQVRLGLKHRASSAPPVDLGDTLAQVLGCLFEDMGRNASVWQRVRGWEPVSTMGNPAADAPPAVNLDFRKMLESFCLGLRNLQDVWSLVLAPATLLDLHRIAQLPAGSFAMSDELWCRVVFDFCLGYRARSINRSHLLASFPPLYLGWLASFVREMQDSSDDDGESRIARLCGVYAQQKPYLMSRWRSPDRFNP